MLRRMLLVLVRCLKARLVIVGYSMQTTEFCAKNAPVPSLRRVVEKGLAVEVALVPSDLLYKDEDSGIDKSLVPPPARTSLSTGFYFERKMFASTRLCC